MLTQLQGKFFAAVQLRVGYNDVFTSSCSCSCSVSAGLCWLDQSWVDLNLLVAVYGGTLNSLHCRNTVTVP